MKIFKNHATFIEGGLVGNNATLALDYYESYLPGLLNERIKGLTDERTAVGQAIEKLKRHRTAVAEHQGIGEAARAAEILQLDREIMRLQGIQGEDDTFTGGVLQTLDGDIQATREFLDSLSERTQGIRDTIARFLVTRSGQDTLIASAQARGAAEQVRELAEEALRSARQDIAAAFVAAAEIGQQAIAHAQGGMYHIGADEELNVRLALARTSP